jgi:hypothetical protein
MLNQIKKFVFNFIELEDQHIVLDMAYKKILINNEKPILIKSRIFIKNSSNLFVNIIIVILWNLIISFEVLIKGFISKKPIVIREFSNIPTATFFWIYYIFRERIFFNINHNFKNNIHLAPISILFLCFLGFKFIFFDGSSSKKLLPYRYRKSFSYPLFPQEKFYKFLNKKEKFVVGIVGNFRKEKVDKDFLLDFISKANRNSKIQFLIGSKSDGAEFINIFNPENIYLTKTQAQYSKFLSKINYLLIFARKETYMYRHSGTISDAIQHAVIPIVPALPVFTSQISNPCSVGFAYNGFDELKAILLDTHKLVSLPSKNFNIFQIHRRQIQNIKFNIC